MRIKLFLTAAVAAIMCLAPAGALAQGGTTGQHHYYLALGDSLARGAQPNSSGATVPTNQGYTDDLYSAEKKKVTDLRLKKLGCLGETTTTMINGGICKYAAGSQLKQAVRFLHTHRGHVAFVTIDIGANDIDNCVSPSGMIDTACLAKGEASIQKNMPKIAGALRKAAGAKVPIVGMTYYDPFLAAWFKGSSGQSEAGESQLLDKQVNSEISNAYKSKSVEVANVAGAFHTYEPLSKTETYHNQQVPVAVVEICKLTWMCAPAPLGPNIHANAKGYRVIAQAFERKKL